MSGQYFVEYEIRGFEGVKQAGPYSAADVTYHYDDIRLYEGVFNCRIIEAPSEESKSEQ